MGGVNQKCYIHHVMHKYFKILFFLIISNTVQYKLDERRRHTYQEPGYRFEAIQAQSFPVFTLWETAVVPF